MQEQTGIPYALLDGRFVATPATYRKLGELIGRRDARRRPRRLHRQDDRDASRERIADIAADERPRVYYARGPRGLETGLGGSINVETIEILARNVAGDDKGGLANVSIEQVLLWNPDVIVTIDQRIRRDCPKRSGLGARRGRARRPRAFIAKIAVRLGRLSRRRSTG